MKMRLPAMHITAALIALAVVSAAHAADLSPTPAAKNICPDTPLRITFTTPPVLGKGSIRITEQGSTTPLETIDVATPTKTKTIGGLANFVYYPILITNNTAAIYLPDHALAYGKAYTVSVDAGTFVDKAGQPLATDTNAWTFTTKAAAPAEGTTKLTVAADGSGDFATVQGALDWIPTGNKTPTTLFIKSGTYNELIYFTNKNNITLLGEDRKKTIIAYANNDKFNPNARPPNSPGVPAGGYRRGMLRANAVTDLTIANLTLHNTTPKGGSQAEALILNGSKDAHAILTNCDLYSFQDTLQINGQAYISDCYIEGDVDFMWGSGPCYFVNCHAHSLRSNAFYTQIRNTAANHGYVYKGCIFDGDANVTGNFLSRIDPGRFPASEVVLLDCMVDSSVGAAAWRFDVNTEGPNVHFWEYNSCDTYGKPVDVSKRFAGSKQLNQTDDKETIANYNDPKWVLGGQWWPALAPIITVQPTVTYPLPFSKNAILTVVAAAVPHSKYQWKKDGVDIAGATGDLLLLEEGKSAGIYTVTITNSAGTVASKPIILDK